MYVQPSTSAEVGRGERRRAVVGLEVGGDRDRDAPAGHERAGAAAAKKPVALGQQLDRLHRDRDQADRARRA